jgi:hypothetical protein
VARTQTQIQNNIVTTSAKSKDLVAYWRMNSSTVADGYTIFPDITGNGHNLKLNSAISFSMVDNIKSTDTETPWP